MQRFAKPAASVHSTATAVTSRPGVAAALPAQEHNRGMWHDNFSGVFGSKSREDDGNSGGGGQAAVNTEGGEEGGSNDFEDEMERELESRLQTLATAGNISGGGSAAIAGGNAGKKGEGGGGAGSVPAGMAMYDNVYFDSDDEDSGGKMQTGDATAGAAAEAARAGSSGGGGGSGGGGAKEKKRAKKDGGGSSAKPGSSSNADGSTGTSRSNGAAEARRRVVENDDLFYDPAMDDADQAWVDIQAAKNRPLESKIGSTDGNNTGQKAAPGSDGTLQCPACLMTVCFDCQQHEHYSGQWRAMFVVNCNADISETLTFKEAKSGKRRSKAQRVEDQKTAEAEMFFPVKCNECKTVVGVYDSDEIYHFFNVISGAID